MASSCTCLQVHMRDALCIGHGKQVGGQDWQLLEMCVVRGEEQGLLRPRAYGALLRAALEGKIKTGGPNCRTRSVLRHCPKGIHKPPGQSGTGAEESLGPSN